ncbi:MAG TPA: hypothetical protein VF261_02015 [Candidatus Saccharimonadales bacterium]
MKKPDKNRFQTHIREPRWQQIVSVLVVLGIIALWIWGATRH